MNQELLVRVLDGNDADSFYRLRLESLESEPLAFGSSPEEFRSRNDVAQMQVRLSISSCDNFVVGAFSAGDLIGMAGFVRFSEQRAKHKGRIWGVFVQPAHRRAGVGRMLLDELLRLASVLEGLDQISLAVNPLQVAARNLYENLGFELYGHEARALKVGDVYVDEDLMMLRVRP